MLGLNISLVVEGLKRVGDRSLNERPRMGEVGRRMIAALWLGDDECCYRGYVVQWSVLGDERRVCVLVGFVVSYEW